MIWFLFCCELYLLSIILFLPLWSARFLFKTVFIFFIFLLFTCDSPLFYPLKQPFRPCFYTLNWFWHSFFFFFNYNRDKTLWKELVSWKKFWSLQRSAPCSSRPALLPTGSRASLPSWRSMEAKLLSTPLLVQPSAWTSTWQAELPERLTWFSQPKAMTTHWRFLPFRSRRSPRLEGVSRVLCKSIQ